MPEEDLYNFYQLTHEQDLQLQEAIAAVTQTAPGKTDAPAQPDAPAEPKEPASAQ